LTLIASLISNLITCAAEIGGIAIVLHLLTGAPYLLLAPLATAALAGSVWVLPFKRPHTVENRQTITLR
jgi:manganese transport protein